MGSPSRTRLQSWRHFSCWGPSLPWLLQPQRLSLRLRLIPGTATAIVDTDGADTTDLMATMATMERDLQKLSQSPLLLLTLMLTLMLGTATMATATVAGDTAVTTGLTATMATTERGLQMPSLSPLLPLSQKLMLMLGTDTMATVTVAMDGAATTGLMAMATMERGPQMLSQSPLLLLSPRLMLMPGTATTATAATDGAVTTGLMDTMATMAKQANREVDSSSDCDFPSTLASISRACA